MDQAAAQFQRSLVLKRQSDLSSLQADMEMLRKFDQDSEAKQSKWTKLAIASVLGGIALVVAVNVLFEFDEIVSVITAVAFAASFVFCLVRMFRFRRTNLDNRRYELCDSLLELIRVDLDHSQPVTARLDCRHPGHKDKLIRKGKAGTWDVKYYADPWLELSGRFLDGTTFHLTKTELLQKRSKRKRSQRAWEERASFKEAPVLMEFRRSAAASEEKNCNVHTHARAEVLEERHEQRDVFEERRRVGHRIARGQRRQGFGYL